jgi:hypothetical protein
MPVSAAPLEAAAVAGPPRFHQHPWMRVLTALPGFVLAGIPVYYITHRNDPDVQPPWPLGACLPALRCRHRTLTNLQHRSSGSSVAVASRARDGRPSRRTRWRCRRVRVVEAGRCMAATSIRVELHDRTYIDGEVACITASRFPCLRRPCRRSAESDSSPSSRQQGARFHK